MEKYITVGEFGMLLGLDLTAEGAVQSWAPGTDICRTDVFIERRHAAGMIHRFLKRVLREPEEAFWEPAKKLSDIYDCRTCVNQVAQVYCKGIMSGKVADTGERIFAMRDYLTHGEAKLAIERMLEPKLRLRVSTEEGKSRTAGQNAGTDGQVLAMLEKYRAKGEKTLLLDVRPEHEYREKHLSGALSVTMANLIKNPALAGQDKQLPIFAYCEQGYQSEIAVNCLREAGFQNVYSFAWTG